MDEDRKEFASGEDIAAARMSEWAKKRFGLTASVCNNFENIPINCAKESGVCVRFEDVKKDESYLRADVEGLKKGVQCHKCGGYCMGGLACMHRMVNV